MFFSLSDFKIMYKCSKLPLGNGGLKRIQGKASEYVSPANFGHCVFGHNVLIHEI